MAVACVDRKVTFPLMLSCLLHSQESAASIYSSSLKTSAIMGFRRGLQTLMTQCGGLHRINCQQSQDPLFVREYKTNIPGRRDHHTFGLITWITQNYFSSDSPTLRKIFQNGPSLSFFAKMLLSYRLFNHTVTRSHPKTKNVTIKE